MDTAGPLRGHEEKINRPAIIKKRLGWKCMDRLKVADGLTHEAILELDSRRRCSSASSSTIPHRLAATVRRPSRSNAIFAGAAASFADGDVGKCVRFDQDTNLRQIGPEGRFPRGDISGGRSD